MKKIMQALVLLFLVSACSQTDEVMDPPLKVSILGSWKLVDWYDDVPRDINNDGTASTDLYSQWNGCLKNSTLILTSDNMSELVYTGIDNNPKCPTGLDMNETFIRMPWEMDDTEETFTLIGDDYLDPYDIIEMTSDVLVLEGSGFITCCNSEIGYFTDGYLRFEKE